jgi:hypothetical protein
LTPDTEGGSRPSLLPKQERLIRSSLLSGMYAAPPVCVPVETRAAPLPARRRSGSCFRATRGHGSSTTSSRPSCKDGLLS